MQARFTGNLECTRPISEWGRLVPQISAFDRTCQAHPSPEGKSDHSPMLQLWVGRRNRHTVPKGRLNVHVDLSRPFRTGAHRSPRSELVPRAFGGTVKRRTSGLATNPHP